MIMNLGMYIYVKIYEYVCLFVSLVNNSDYNWR